MNLSSFATEIRIEHIILSLTEHAALSVIFFDFIWNFALRDSKALITNLHWWSHVVKPETSTEFDLSLLHFWYIIFIFNLFHMCIPCWVGLKNSMFRIKIECEMRRNTMIFLKMMFRLATYSSAYTKFDIIWYLHKIKALRVNLDRFFRELREQVLEK